MIYHLTKVLQTKGLFFLKAFDCFRFFFSFLFVFVVVIFFSFFFNSGTSSFSDGSKWKTRRRLITPTFHFKILNTFIQVFEEQAAILVTHLEVTSPFVGFLVYFGVFLFFDNKLHVQVYLWLVAKCRKNVSWKVYPYGTVFTHELVSVRNRTRERSNRVRFLIQTNECVNTIQTHFPSCIVFINMRTDRDSLFVLFHSQKILSCFCSSCFQHILLPMSHTRQIFSRSFFQRTEFVFRKSPTL